MLVSFVVLLLVAVVGHACHWIYSNGCAQLVAPHSWLRNMCAQLVAPHSWLRNTQNTLAPRKLCAAFPSLSAILRHENGAGDHTSRQRARPPALALYALRIGAYIVPNP